MAFFLGKCIVLSWVKFFGLRFKKKYVFFAKYYIIRICLGRFKKVKFVNIGNCALMLCNSRYYITKVPNNNNRILLQEF